MQKKFLIILSLLFAVMCVNAQMVKQIIRFSNKQGSGYSLAQPSAFLSPKAIERRAKHHIPIDSTDLPVNPNYLAAIRNIAGVKILSVSRWLNQAMVEAPDSATLAAVNALPFVMHSQTRSFQTTANASDPFVTKFKETFGPLPDSAYKPSSQNKALGIEEDAINYGVNYNQVHIHEGEYLHNLGFQGEGVTIAMLDAGFFGYKSNPAFESLRSHNRVKDEYDFVKNETSVEEDNAHGMYCLSILAANLPGTLVGTAPNADYFLYRTEDVTSESIAEEQFWASAAERADSMGADILSSSLGYVNFDDPLLNHSYADRDGNTALITNAADLAAKKGLLVTISCGNSGASTNDNKYVMCPGDADSVLTVGAVDGAGLIAGFSCWGPNGAGKVKPNVVSVGKGTSFINVAGLPGSGNGTSLSNPNVAGLIACLWQAFSEFSNMEIIDAVQKSSDKYSEPDDRYGYGLPNFRVAYQILQQERQDRLEHILSKSWLKVFPSHFNQNFTALLKAPSTGNASFQFVDIQGRIIEKRNLAVQQDNYYYIDFSPAVTSTGAYYLHYNDGKNKTTLKLVKKR